MLAQFTAQGGHSIYYIAPRLVCVARYHPDPYVSITGERQGAFGAKMQ
jgi:hypothetical protein